MILKYTRVIITTILLYGSLLLLQACASMDPDYEEPTVTLSSFRALPSDGGMPNFEIGLNIINPNSTSFRLEGVVYTVSVQGQDVVKGVGKDLPVLEGYSEQTNMLTATANLFAGVRLMMDMVNTPNEELNIDFEAKHATSAKLRSIRNKQKCKFRNDGKKRTN